MSGAGLAPSEVADATLRVDRTLLDELTTLTDRLLVANNQLLHRQRVSRSAGLAAPTTELDDITRELRDAIARSRREPINRAWLRVPRLLRDRAVASGARLDLSLQAPDALAVDHALVAALRDPVTELAMAVLEAELAPLDEALPALTESGTAEAEIRLSIEARIDDGQVQIDITHAGDTINIPATVADALAAKGGSATTEPTTAGTQHRLSLPIADQHLTATLLRCDTGVMALPASVVVDRFRLDLRRTRIDEIAGAEVVEHDGRLVPLIWLRDVLCLEPSGAPRQEVLVITHEHQELGLVVDRVLPGEELLLQSIQFPLPDWGPFDSTAICGSGDVALVLDLPAMVETIGLSDDTRRSADASSGVRDARRGPAHVLAARIGDATVTIPTALVDGLASADPADFVSVAGQTMTQDEQGPIALLAIPDLATAGAGLMPILVHQRDGVRFGIAVDEVLGEHHLPAPSDTPAIGIASAPMIGHRSLDAIALDHLIGDVGTERHDHG